MHGARRRRRLPAHPGELVAAIGVVLAGLGLIAGIVLLDPRWQRIVAAWRERVAALSAAAPSVAPPSAAVASPSIEDSLAVGIRPRTIRPEMPARQPAAPASRPPSRTQSDTMQVMAGVLVSQLGSDVAWRTALANADAHPGDSPEHAYWRAVAAVIRGGGFRPQP